MIIRHFKPLLLTLCWLAVSGFSLESLAQSGKQDYSAYLFAYFTGNAKSEEAVRFAVSKDGYNYKALNKNQPVLDSEKISSTGAIRDPHILRGEDGKTFYMVLTDMESAQGWSSNRSLILLKSNNLIDWTSKVINIQQTYSKQQDLLRVWAPQTIYDHKAKKYMVYWSMKHGDGPDIIYYAYANKDFTAFEKAPKVLFLPKNGLSCIDGDIVFKDGLYHMFYKTEGHGNGIKLATTASLTSGKWTEYPDYKQQTKDAVEGSCVFKLHDSDEYIFMYDVYGRGKYQFTKSKDLQNFEVIDKQVSMDFHPRHGTVISITRDEAIRLQEKWGGVPHEVLEPKKVGETYSFSSTGNPIITHKYTADPAALVKGDTLWMYLGHDFEGGQKGYKMKDWLVYSTTDMKNWTEYPVPMKITDFAWAKSGDAFAGHVTERNGKYYWYVSTNWSGIGVGVSDSPIGPFKDALGKPLLTNDDCFASSHVWACIDPAVFIDDDGQAWIFWGNRECYYAKLKENMIEIDGEIKQVKFDGLDFTEAPWIHKHKGKYYLTYASGFPEKIAYAMADKIDGPYVYKGLLNEIAGNSNTNHQAILEFKGAWYFIYHNGAIQTDGSSYSRSVCIDKMEYNEDGTIKRIVMTSEGVN